MFSVFIPKLDPGGSIKRGENKEVIMEEEFGELTCWHIMHRGCWKKDLLTMTTLAPISEESKEDIDTDDEEVTPGKEVMDKKKKKTPKAATST